MKLNLLSLAVLLASEMCGVVAIAHAQAAPAEATILVSGLPITMLGADSTLTRVVYFENFSIKADLRGNQPFSVTVPVDGLSTIDPNRPRQRIVAYAGSMNDGVELQIRPVHAGGTYPVDIYVGSIPAAQRLTAINTICAHTPSANDIDAQATRYFVCRRIVIDTTSEDVATFRALKGWWEANYILSTGQNAYIAPDPDVLGRIEDQLNATPISPRFASVFKLDDLRREIREVKSASLADYGNIQTFINQGRIADAQAVFKAAAHTFDALSTEYHMSVVDGISRSRLQTDGKLLDALESRAPSPQ